MPHGEGDASTHVPLTMTTAALDSSLAAPQSAGTPTVGQSPGSPSVTPTGTGTSTGGRATPAGDSAYVAQDVLAVFVVLVGVSGTLMLFRAVARKASNPAETRDAHGGLVTGRDNRYSTSKVIAVLWTLVVAWMVATEALIAANSAVTFAALLSGASSLYFVFLGGPYAAAAFAKGSTQTKTAQGKLNKTPSSAPTPLDVIADDTGNVDLYDFQYTLFNLLALLIVVFSFLPHPGHGLPAIPDFLAILTGGAALTYTVNKAIAVDGPQITSVTPAQARVGDTVAITGVGLFTTTPGSAAPAVMFGTVAANKVMIPAGKTDTLTATIADAPSGTTSLTNVGHVDVTVAPPLASPITARQVLSVVADTPRIANVTGTVHAGDTLTVTGHFLLAPGSDPGDASKSPAPVGGLTPKIQVSGQDWPVTFDGSYSDAGFTLRAGTAPAGIEPQGQAELTLQRASVPSLTREVDYRV